MVRDITRLPIYKTRLLNIKNSVDKFYNMFQIIYLIFKLLVMPD